MLNEQKTAFTLLKDAYWPFFKEFLDTYKGDAKELLEQISKTFEELFQSSETDLLKRKNLIGKCFH